MGNRNAVRNLALWLSLAGLLWAPPARAQEANRAGVVVVGGDGAVDQRCVAFAEESINGYELIVRAGFDVVSEQAAMGATVCALDGEGCAFPREACFCQCQGRECTYWAYWQQDDSGVWRYSGAGAGNSRVRDGAVEGWVWGPGSVSEAPAPPAVTFADICPVDTAGVAGAATTITTTARITPTASRVTLLTPPTTPLARETSSEGVGVEWGGLLLTLLPLPLLLAGYWIWRRRKVHAKDAEHSDL